MRSRTRQPARPHRSWSPSGPNSRRRTSPPDAAIRPSSQMNASCAGSTMHSVDRKMTSPAQTAIAIRSTRRCSSSAASCIVAPSAWPKPASHSRTRPSTSTRLNDGVYGAIHAVCTSRPVMSNPVSAGRDDRHVPKDRKRCTRLHPKGGWPVSRLFRRMMAFGIGDRPRIAASYLGREPLSPKCGFTRDASWKPKARPGRSTPLVSGALWTLARNRPLEWAVM